MQPRAVMIGALILGVGAVFVFSSSQSSGESNYFTDWNKALAEARTEEKPILLNFGGPW